MSRILRPVFRAASAVALAVLCAACGGSTPSSPSAPSPAPNPSLLQVAGEYRITQVAVETSCGDTGTPATVTGTVTHTAGAEAFVLRDTGGTTFTGTVQRDGRFAATATFGPDASGSTFTQRLEGSFTASGFSGR